MTHIAPTGAHQKSYQVLVTPRGPLGGQWPAEIPVSEFIPRPGTYQSSQPTDFRTRSLLAAFALPKFPVGVISPLRDVSVRVAIPQSRGSVMKFRARECFEFALAG